MKKNDNDPGAISGALIGTTFLAAIVGAMKLAKSPIPRPGAPAKEVRAYYTDSAVAVRYSAAGQLLSALSLARFTVSVVRMAGRSGPGAPVLKTAAALSGAAAVATAATSALTHASLTADRPRDDDAFTQGARRMFAIGGPVHGVAFGTLIAVLTVSGHRTGDLGRAAATTGLVSATAGVLSPLYFRWETAGWLIPIGRFTGYTLAGITGTRLARAGSPRRPA